MSRRGAGASGGEPARLLAQGLKRLGMEAPARAQASLLAYLELIAKWNRAYNLTAVRDIEQMIPRHLLDSLAAAPLLAGTRALDVGTGAGLPGIPLAVLRPDMQFTLLDGNGKKIRFVRQAAQLLGLGNVSAIQSRVEAFHPEGNFDTLMARAVSGLPELVRVCAHLMTPTARLIAYKGEAKEDELSSLPAGFGLAALKRVEVPGVHGARHLVIVRREPQA